MRTGRWRLQGGCVGMSEGADRSRCGLGLCPLGWNWKWGPLAHAVYVALLANTSRLARLSTYHCRSPYVELPEAETPLPRRDTVIPMDPTPSGSVSYRNAFPKSGWSPCCYGSPWPLKNIRPHQCIQARSPELPTADWLFMAQLGAGEISLRQFAWSSAVPTHLCF